MSETEQIEALILRVAAGDRVAFARLYDETSSTVYGLLLAMLRVPAEAEEVAQEVFLEVWRKAGSFDLARGSGSTWISLMARSRALDRIRRDRSYSGAVDRAGATVSPEDLLGTPRPDPEESTVLGERRALVRSALQDMPDEQRTAVVLAFFGGLSHSEIAGRLGIPLGTVKSRIRTGLQKVESTLRPVLGRKD